MAGRNRHLTGKTNDITVEVMGNIVVEAGDLMWLGDYNNRIPAGTAADYRAYPINKHSSSCDTTSVHNTVKNSFLGVAMTGSQSGTTQNVTIATSGVFRYKLEPNAFPTAVSAGWTISTTTSYPDGAGCSPQRVRLSTSAASAYVGYCVKDESAATFVDFFLRSKYGPAGLIT